jgi:poly-gamma-glutamate synthesis protein (capsule biosynthesis protein)
MASTGETLRLALAGDTMLGRKVADAIAEGREPFAPEVVAAAAEADLFIANLECCISERGEPWPDPRKPFFFRAPPRAAEILAAIGVDCVTLANNHALDFGAEALLDTFDHLQTAGIAWVGAGTDAGEARAPRVLAAKQRRLAVLGASDHPADFAAASDRPGIAYADLRTDPQCGWLPAAVMRLLITRGRFSWGGGSCIPWTR